MPTDRSHQPSDDTPWPGGHVASTETVAVLLGFCALALGVTYPLVWHLGTALPNDLGDPLLNTWILAWDADRLRHGLQGLWDAPNFFPYPRTLTYSEHLLGIAFFTAPVQWVTGNPVAAYNTGLLLSYVLAGSGMYLLTRSITGNPAAALVAGVVFACLPYRVAQISHLQVLVYGWMPIGLFALHRYFQSGSRTALLGFVVAFVLQGLSNLYFLYFFSLPVAIVALVGLFGLRSGLFRRLGELLVAALLILVLLSPIVFAYYESRADQGLIRHRGMHIAYSADVVSYGHVSRSLWLWGDVLRRGRAEGELFPGLVLVVLATTGLVTTLRPGVVSARARRTVWLYAAIGAAAFVLSLGPEPRAFGRLLSPSGPYDWVLAITPGLDGIRVPARLAVVVYLALAVIAAVGVSALLGRRSRRVQLIVCGACAAAAVVEGYAPIHLRAITTPPHRQETLAHLATSAPGAVLELPLGARPQHRTEYNTRYQFDALTHGHPVVNGFSGYSTPLLDYLSRSGSPLDQQALYPDLIGALRQLGVRYLVVNAELYENREDARRTIAAIRRADDQIVQTTRFDPTTVFQLAAWREPPPVVAAPSPLTPSTFRVAVSHGSTRWPLAVDGNLRTRWHTARPQRGDERIEITFDRPRDVARLRFAHRSLDDYPRGLRVESIDERGVARPLYDGGVLRQLLLAIVADPASIPVDVLLAPNQTRTLVIRQTGRTRGLYWSIHEFSVWSRN